LSLEMVVDVLALHRAVDRNDGDVRVLERGDGCRCGLGVDRVDDDGVDTLGGRVGELVLLGGGVVLGVRDLQGDACFIGRLLGAVTQGDEERVVQRRDRQGHRGIAAGGPGLGAVVGGLATGVAVAGGGGGQEADGQDRGHGAGQSRVRHVGSSFSVICAGECRAGGC
jgi:hypothetical protein